jgi:hypothetical protein
MNPEKQDRIARAIRAEPARAPCPQCQQLVKDWHREWYPPELQPRIYKGERYADCPWCGKPVTLGFGVELPRDTNATPTKRDIDMAAEWALLYSPEKNLPQHVKQDTVLGGQQYQGYWSEEEMQQAHERAEERFQQQGDHP